MKKKLLAVAMGAMLAAGAANAVTVNHAGLGDLLVSPSYFIGAGGWNRHIPVLSAGPLPPGVARMIIDDPLADDERMDFSVYLAPEGMWDMAVRAESLALFTTARPDEPVLYL